MRRSEKKKSRELEAFGTGNDLFSDKIVNSVYLEKTDLLVIPVGLPVAGFGDASSTYTSLPRAYN